MSEPKRPLASTIQLAGVAADYVAGAMLAVIFITLVAQTGMRYIVRSPLSTSQEIATIAFLWLVFWSAATTIPLREHVRFDLLTSTMPLQARRLISLLANLFYFAIYLWAAKSTWEYFTFLELESTASLAISYQIAFLPYFIFFAAFPLRIAIAVLKLLGRDWMDNL